ncbi:excinuclease ABC subunit UvrA [Xanthocytophaga agilis]|uniref:UvrABC system protein A n=1 Tax=Xanthocytophaga agilis TaxID=3048010 RepID=A0AAE3RA37_9BACT|nr:excinuclease ABC subunit UvrA [Xanthocytophaga agilis]MDJ1506726.1 excinuclease ABC subunit UvrA [Xanthocytophaga agilis]
MSNKSMVSKATTLPGISDLDPREYIIIKGARVNNLKNLSVAIPRNKLVVITGLSGSGKSSLAFDTLFAEGQRMYVESLGSYARQFLGRMEKPEVEYIKGVSPAIAIEQKVNTRNPRSTVGTTTEIYDYLKLLFSRIGKTYSPVSGQEVRRDTVTDVIDYLYSFEDGQRFLVLAPLKPHTERKLLDELNILLQKGFTRIQWNDELLFIEEIISDTKRLSEIDKKVKQKHSQVFILIDRNSVRHNDEDNEFRISDSIQTAFFEGDGECMVQVVDKESKLFSDRFELDGITFEEPSVNFFSFNNPYGACRTCEGFGTVLGLDPDLIIPDKTLSVYEGAIAPWRTEKMSEWLTPLIKNGIRFDFPIHRPYEDLSEEQKTLLWKGNEYFKGIDEFFRYVEGETYKIQYRVLLSRYRGRTVCPDCRGSRIRKDAGYVKIGGKSIIDLVLMPVTQVTRFFDETELSEYEQKVSGRIITEIRNRLSYLDKVGLGYLTMNRISSTLSGGEYQRIKLATSLGSALVGSMYILDEPSIGLHPRDTQKLISVLKMLRDLGNTVIVVEHEEEVLRAADQIIDIGPDAGAHGGELIFQGSLEDVDSADTYTTRYLNGTDEVPVPKRRRQWTDAIEIKGARENNLKNVNVKIPLGILTAITGVSGSGKSTLVKKIVYPALAKHLGLHNEESARYESISGSLSLLTAVEFVDQNPIGKSSRSNPVTYIKAYDHIRQLMADQSLAKTRGYTAGHFSFNIDGGRCEACQGEGHVTIEMQFMADIHLTCESCHGKRFKQEVLEVTYKDKNIADILDMTVDEAVEFFQGVPKVADRLKPLQDVGLGYVRLGQSSDTLSGGEAQRVKLASFLGKGNAHQGKTLFIFDEPTTGLHFHDIKKLLNAINALVEQGDSVVLIEHNTEIIKSADWVIDLGPEGGDKGGYLVFEGVPEELIREEKSYTGQFLRGKL